MKAGRTVTDRNLIYSCPKCGQIVTILHKGGGSLVCCGEVMKRAGQKEEGDKKAPDNAPYWSCSRCHYVLQAATPPAVCPACNERCQFVDVTCYIPECGFTGIDDRLVE